MASDAAELDAAAPALHSPRTVGARLFETLLNQRFSTGLVIGIALLLGATSLALDVTADDHFHALSLRSHPGLGGVARAPWDLFAFAKDPATNHALMEEGAFPWWTDPKLVIAFLRPLSSLSLWLDYALWPASPLCMHLHSLAWFAGLLAAVAALLRALAPSRGVANLALLIYGIDDARSMPVAWIAHRNALVALTPALLALYAHHRFRASGTSGWRVAAVLLFAVGLLGGEPAVPVLGYFAAYALCLEKGPLGARALTLLPYLALVLVWRRAYDALGYGALNSGVYVDPGREPLVFARELATRLPVLLLSQFALPPADLWEVYPLVSTLIQPALLLLAALVLAGLAALFWPMMRADPRMRFWAIGAALATIPVCGTHPEDRVLSATSLGAAAVIAQFLVEVWQGHTLRRALPVRASAGSLAVIHLLIAPLAFPVRVLAVDAMENVMLRADDGLPPVDVLAHETLVMLNPPVDLLAVYWPVYRLGRGLGLPAHFRWLATGETALTVTRVDARTLRVRPEGGFLSHASQRMFRRVENTWPHDARVRLSGLTFEVTDLTDDGRPAEVVVQFDLPLEHASLRFVQWGEHSYVPFPLPALGASVRVPAVSLQTALFEEPRPSQSPPRVATPGAREKH